MVPYILSHKSFVLILAQARYRVLCTEISVSRPGLLGDLLDKIGSCPTLR